MSARWLRRWRRRYCERTRSQCSVKGSGATASVFLATRDSAGRGRTCGKAAHNRALESPRSTVVISCLHPVRWMRFQDESTIKRRKEKKRKEKKKKETVPREKCTCIFTGSPRREARKERKGKERKGRRESNLGWELALVLFFLVFLSLFLFFEASINGNGTENASAAYLRSGINPEFLLPSRGSILSLFLRKERDND